MNRQTSWGNWGITFYEMADRALPGEASPRMAKCHGRYNFPCGPQGPTDGFYGSPERKRYEQMCRDWMNHGVLPAGLEKLPI